MQKSESKPAGTTKAVEVLMKDCGLNIAGAMRVTELSRTTVTKIVNGKRVKPSTRDQFIQALQRHKKVLEAPLEPPASSGILEALKRSTHVDPSVLEDAATLARPKAKELRDFLQVLTEALDPETPPKKNSDVYRFIEDAQRIYDEFAILKRRLQL